MYAEGEKRMTAAVQHRLGATELRNQLGALLNRVHNRKEHLLIEKLGIPVAAVISMDEYEEYRRLATAQMHTDLVRRLGPEAERQGLTEEELLAELKETRRTLYAETYGDEASR